MKEPGVEIIPPVPSLEFPVPAIIAAAGDKASEYFLEFFAATIRNKNTRAAYVQAAAQFCRWCTENGLQLATIRPLHVSAYIETKPLTVPSIKQHLAALRGLFNWLVIKQVVPENPALFVKGPRFSRQVGITPIMEAEQMRQLLDSIKTTRRVKMPRKHGGGYEEVPDLKGLRDRAVIAIMGYTFARVSAVVGMTVGDYRLEGKPGRLRLMEKGNKEKLVWLHREAEKFLDAFIAAAGIEDPKAPIFQTLNKAHRLSGEVLSRRDMLRAVKLRCNAAGLSESFCNHTFEHLKRTLGEYNFAGQYQQSPAPLGGGMVKFDWFRGYIPGEQPAKFDMIIQSWDTANKSTELSDFSVCTTWGRKNKKLYLLHVLRKRLDYPDLKRAVWQQAARFQPTNILIEDKASGTQLIQELIRDGVHGVTRYEPTMDKIMRMNSVTSTLENGFVYVPTGADWLDVYLQELTTFPACKHDDQADSTSQALDWVKQNTHIYPVFEYYRQLELRTRLGLPDDYGFIECDEDEPITAIQEGTGRTIVWTGHGWAEYTLGD